MRVSRSEIFFRSGRFRFRRFGDSRFGSSRFGGGFTFFTLNISKSKSEAKSAAHKYRISHNQPPYIEAHKYRIPIPHRNRNPPSNQFKVRKWARGNNHESIITEETTSTKINRPTTNQKQPLTQHTSKQTAHTIRYDTISIKMIYNQKSAHCTLAPTIGSVWWVCVCVEGDASAVSLFSEERKQYRRNSKTPQKHNTTQHENRSSDQ